MLGAGAVYATVADEHAANRHDAAGNRGARTCAAVYDVAIHDIGEALAVDARAAADAARAVVVGIARRGVFRRAVADREAFDERAVGSVVRRSRSADVDAPRGAGARFSLWIGPSAYDVRLVLAIARDEVDAFRDLHDGRQRLRLVDRGSPLRRIGIFAVIYYHGVAGGAEIDSRLDCLLGVVPGCSAVGIFAGF